MMQDAPSPKNLLIQAQILADKMRFSPQSRHRTTHSERIWTYRSYTGGEPASMIDWKQSARGNKIYIREHEQLTHPPIFFWIDPTLDEPAIESALLIFTALSYILVEKDRTVRWLSTKLKPTQTRSQVQFLLSEGLRNLKPTASGLNMENVHGGHIILAADFRKSDSELSKNIRRYRSQGNSGMLLQLGPPLPGDLPVLVAAKRSAWLHITCQDRHQLEETLSILLEKTFQSA